MKKLLWGKKTETYKLHKKAEKSSKIKCAMKNDSIHKGELALEQAKN